MSTQLEVTIPLPPAPPDWPEFSWRPMRRDDVAAVFSLLLAVDKADDRDSAGTLPDAQREFDDPWCNPETDSLLALAANGHVVAFVRTFLNPQPEDEHRCWLWFESHPDHRRPGLEEALLNWAEARARQRLAAADSALPKRMRYGLQDNLVSRIALLERRGYSAVRYFYRMRRDLREPIPDRPLPDGIALRTYEPALSRPALDAFNEAFRDHWSFEPISPDDWQMFFLQRSTFRPDLTYLAMEDDQVAGLSFNAISPEENARSGIHEGWVAELAVRRPWRKRGIATALLCETMRAFKAEGLRYATLGVDTQNPTGALGLYERLGFKPVRRFVQLEKRAEA